MVTGSETPSPRLSYATEYIHLLPELSWENRAINFFLDQFIVAPSQHENVGWFEFLPELSSIATSFSPLGLAFRAVAYLSLANRFNEPRLKTWALQYNGDALHATNEALKYQSSAVEDSTLAAILVMCLFGVSLFWFSELHLTYLSISTET